MKVVIPLIYSEVSMRGFKCIVFVILFVANSVFLIAGDVKKENTFRKPKNGTFVIAHRGVHVGIPENSLPAYKKAIELGCDFIEVDIRTTKDGEFVSVHNSDVDNYVMGTKGKVREMTLAELKLLDIGEKKGEEWKHTRIPTFEEILQLCQGKIGIYLDLKDAPVEGLMLLIKKFKMENDVVWYIPASYLLETENLDKLFGKSYIMPDPGSEENLDLVIQKLQPKVIATDMGALSKSFVEKCHNYNAKVFVDEKKGDKDEWARILEWGTDGIQTDNPEQLIKYLNHINNK